MNRTMEDVMRSWLGINDELCSPGFFNKSQGRKYEVRKTDSGWSYRIIYPDGHVGIEHSGYYTEEAARAAARDDRDGKKEWHS